MYHFLSGDFLQVLVRLSHQNTQEWTYLQLNEVKFGSTRVHQRVEVLVARELRLDQCTDVSLKKNADMLQICLQNILYLHEFGWLLSYKKGPVCQI